MWNCFHLNVIEPHEWEVKIGSDNGLGLSDKSQTLLTRIYVAIWRQRGHNELVNIVLNKETVIIFNYRRNISWIPIIIIIKPTFALVVYVMLIWFALVKINSHKTYYIRNICMLHSKIFLETLENDNVYILHPNY